MPPVFTHFSSTETMCRKLREKSNQAPVGALYQGVNELKSSQSPPFQGGVGVVRKVAQPPYRCREASAFQSGALRPHLQGCFASLITTPCPSLKRRGISLNSYSFTASMTARFSRILGKSVPARPQSRANPYSAPSKKYGAELHHYYGPEAEKLTVFGITRSPRE